MAISMQTAMKKFSKSLAANVLSVILSTITGIIIPKYMGSTHYGYWQVFVLYLTYIPYLHLGLVDGIYLREGGKDYSEVDKPMLHTQFWMSLSYDFVIAGAFFATGLSLSGGHRVVLCLTAFECMFYMPRVFCQYVLQATGRVEDYAKNLVLERIICASLQLVFIFTGHSDLVWMASSEIIGKCVSLASILYRCRGFVRGRGVGLIPGWHAIKEDFKSGCKLTFSTVSGMLLIGIIQFAVEFHWPIEMFGMVSFALVSVESTVAFINQISIVLYPLLKQSGSDAYAKIFFSSGSAITLLGTIVLACYYPLQSLLDKFLPSYATALVYLGYLMPLCLFESRTSLLLNTFLKTLRKEKRMMEINIVMLALSLASTFLTIGFLRNLDAVVCSIVLLLVFRSALSEHAVHGGLDIHDWEEFIVDVGISAVFLVCSFAVKGLCGWLLFVAFALVVRLVRRERYRNARNLFQ